MAKIFKSRFSSFEIPEFPLHAALFLRLESHGDAIALVHGITGENYTFSQLVKSSKNAASAFVKMGLRKGDVVAIFCPNIPQYSMVFLATWACGGTAMTLNPAYTAYELEYYLKDANPSFIVTTQEFAPKVRKACEKHHGIKHIITIEPTEGCVPFSDLVNDDGSRYPDDVEINAKEDVALLLYSSGTTGLPKGVMLTHFNVLANMAQLGNEEARVTSDKDNQNQTLMGILPFFHTAGIFGQIMFNFAAGCKLVCLPRFEPHLFLSTIEKYKVSILLLVPSLALFMNKSPLPARYDLSSVKRAGFGAAPLKEDQRQLFRQKLKLSSFNSTYGMTEATCVATQYSRDETPKPGTVGLLIANMEAKVLSIATGESCGPNEEGELCLRGPNIMKGYLNRPEATKTTIDRDGFLQTGDTGYIDADGYIFLVDRIKELIKYKGFQVAPAELEGVLLEHCDVLDAGVTGVPDEDAGQVPRAFVVKRTGSPLTEEQLQAFAHERVAPFKRLRGGLKFVESVPRNQSGKVLRRKLVETFDTKSNL